MSSAGGTKTVGVSMSAFDDNFLTVLRNGMVEHAETLDGVDLQIEDAEDDVGKQLNQIENFIAAGVDAIVVNAVDTSATQAISDAAAAAGIPLVYVNRQPINIDTLPDNQAFVASDETEAGTLQATEVCRLLKENGAPQANLLVLQGELSNQGAVVRTQMIHDTAATPDCSFMKIVEEQTGNWQRQQGADLMANWITAGVEYDAVVANNDEMAIGAIQALKSAGIAMDSVVVAGIDATQDALAAMQAGDLDVTVFQDAAGQGRGAVNAALALAGGEAVEQKVYIPFQLVTPENLQDYMTAN
ncbi:sugar ABC transporter substrate-binding protein [Rubellimicrobium rubrum]|uniref:Sugar ABC transporter substrate-binding protein n=1 Tax=Rubellimicrobium rubrum TaxID=2585369 RepID=A0A5C4MTN6_9RHOB|nr:sugar ABC transporter substrate-binding protein [Rubellimicrobium rubrum]TNC48034.1 sugar ABC transporter substrate-binding protein [Rubellimicrobium rubrum]